MLGLLSLLPTPPMQELFIFSINRENNENQLYYMAVMVNYSQIIVAVCKIIAKAEKTW